MMALNEEHSFKNEFNAMLLAHRKISYHMKAPRASPKIHIQIETKKKATCHFVYSIHCSEVFEFTTQMQITDTSGIGFKTDNLLKTMGKLIF